MKPPPVWRLQNGESRGLTEKYVLIIAIFTGQVKKRRRTKGFILLMGIRYGKTKRIKQTKSRHSIDAVSCNEVLQQPPEVFVAG